MIDAEKLAAVKGYMRIETEDEDEIISAMYAAAQDYLAGAGVEEPEDPSPLYDLALWGLTLHYYDHRADCEAAEGFPPGLRPIINQLKASAGI